HEETFIPDKYGIVILYKQTLVCINWRALMSQQQNAHLNSAETAEQVTVHQQLAEHLDRARLGGSESSRKKIKKAGKMLVRERLDYLFDDGEYFEDGLLARFSEELYADAVVCAYGKIDGRQVCVI